MTFAALLALVAGVAAAGAVVELAALAGLRLAVVGKSTDEKRTRARRTVVYLGTSCAVAETRLWGRWHPPDGFAAVCRQSWHQGE